MGVTSPLAPLTEPATGDSPWLRRLGWSSLFVNIAIVVTGGVVRLTGSGLGCPTWPQCTEDSFTPHGAMTIHAAIEFGNRLVTFLIAAVAIATFLAARRARRGDLTRLALILALGVPAQAVIGGITVLTDLNPWTVAFHLLVSMAMIGVAVLFVDRVYTGAGPRVAVVPSALGSLAWLTFAAGWVVLYLGTVVTGSGPHAGDAEAPRNGLDPESVSQLHVDAVMFLLGLSVALILAYRAVAAPARTSGAARLLLGVLLVQGLIGFVQYFTGLPVVLVGLHLFGAALTSAAITWVVITTRERATRAG